MATALAEKVGAQGAAGTAVAFLRAAPDVPPDTADLNDS